MKVEPGAAVIFTLIQSESTVVPPVTAERSPPASRMTGADSPVMADSLTEATPSMISPSPGMRSPASTSTTSPTFRSSAETPSTTSLMPLCHRVDQALGVRVGARAAQRVGLRLAAPFGHGFGEIGEEHGEPQPGGDLAGEQRGAVLRDEIAQEESVTTTDTTSVTKMTGLRASWRGSSLRNASIAARADDGRDRTGRERRLCDDMDVTPFRRSCRRASGNARRSGRARAPGNIAAGRG